MKVVFNMRFIIMVCFCLGSRGLLAAPSGLLNDTGQTKCLYAAANEVCNNFNTGPGSNMPGQDAIYGRDAAYRVGTLIKPDNAGGNAGFAFKALRLDGTVIALTNSAGKLVPSEAPRCIHDTVTNLVWEVKTNDGGVQDRDWTYKWGSVNAYDSYCGQTLGGSCNTYNYISAINALSLCGETSNNWRLPTRRELLSIIDNSKFGPALDPDFFVNIGAGPMVFWSSNVAVSVSPPIVWVVDFDNGSSGSGNETSYTPYHVILVRDAP